MTHWVKVSRSAPVMPASPAKASSCSSVQPVPSCSGWLAKTVAWYSFGLARVDRAAPGRGGPRGGVVAEVAVEEGRRPPDQLDLAGVGEGLDAGPVGLLDGAARRALEVLPDLQDRSVRGGGARVGDAEGALVVGRQHARRERGVGIGRGHGDRGRVRGVAGDDGHADDAEDDDHDGHGADDPDHPLALALPGVGFLARRGSTVPTVLPGLAHGRSLPVSLRPGPGRGQLCQYTVRGVLG